MVIKDNMKDLTNHFRNQIIDENNPKKILSSAENGDFIVGELFENLEDALSWCNKMYKRNNKIILSITDYRDATTLWNMKDILYELGYISKKKYQRYINSGLY